MNILGLLYGMFTKWSEVKRFLHSQIDAEQTTQFEIIRLAGLSRNSYYKIFGSDRANTPMQRKSVYGLAKALDLHVQYEDGIPQFESNGPTYGFSDDENDGSGKVEFSDKGLGELLNTSNREKYDISPYESMELATIADSRNSDGTVAQWLAILYSIRNLDKKKKE